MTIKTLPDFVLVESSKGKVTQCYGLLAEHWSDPEISHVQQQIDEDEDNSEEERERILDTDKGQVDYDRPAGIEHLRRDCPKVPIDIKGTTFLGLIDSGAELNTMKKETAERAMLPITSLPRGISLARMVSANSTTE